MKSHSENLESIKKELQKYKEETELLRKLGSTVGFFNYYFYLLRDPQYRTRVEAFDAVNDLYFENFGDYRFSSYNSFRGSLKNFLKPKQ